MLSPDHAPLACAASTEAPSARDLAFIRLLKAYWAHGGLARLHHPGADAGVSARADEPVIRSLVEAGHLFGFDWHHALWIPRFQFVGPGPSVAPGPRRVVAELGPAFDGWAVAHWFVQARGDLAGWRPIACLATRLPEVLQAARIDRDAATACEPCTRCVPHRTDPPAPHAMSHPSRPRRRAAAR